MKYSPKNMEILKRWRSRGFIDTTKSEPEQLMMAIVLDNQAKIFNKLKDDKSTPAKKLSEGSSKFGSWLSELVKGGFIKEPHAMREEK